MTKTTTTNEAWCDDCHGYTHMPYCPSYRAADEISDTERWRVDPYASCDIILDSGDGRASYLENRVAQVFGDSKEIRAQRAESIVRNHNEHQQCATQLRFLGNRAEELSSLLAGMTTERDRLREALRRMCDKFYPHACNVNGPERTCDKCEVLRQASAALNHAKREES